MKVGIRATGGALAAARGAVTAGGGQALAVELPVGADGWAMEAGEALVAAERALDGDRLDAVVVGGTDAGALAAALAASRAGLPVIRLDAGERRPGEREPTAELADRLAELAVCAGAEQRRIVLDLGIEPDQIHPDLPAALGALRP